MKTAKKNSMANALMRVLPMLFKRMPIAFTILALLGAAQAAAAALVVPFNERLFDSLAAFVTGGIPVNAVYQAAILVALFLIARSSINAAYNFHQGNYISIKGMGFLNSVIQAKAGRLSAEDFEDKSKLDDIEKAAAGADNIMWAVGEMNVFVFYYLLYTIIMAVYLWNLRPILAGAILLVFVPLVITKAAESRMWAALEEVSAPLRRQRNHYAESLTARGAFKETRLLGAFGFFKGLYMGTVELIVQKEWNVHRKIALLTLGLNIIKLLGWLGIIVLLYVSLVDSYISVGAFAAVFFAIERMYAMINEGMDRMKWGVVSNAGRICNFVNLLDMPEREGGDAPPDFASGGIKAANVSFSYPDAKQPAVNDVSLTISPGETVAIVGENGSGKTTLVKLLMGLYLPNRGSITIGGCDTAKTTERALSTHTTAVFQDYARYAFCLGENIKISDYDSTVDIIPVLAAADVDYKDTATFPQGLQTALFREFDGVELSGGQWQRVAMARGMYRRHDFIVLDEPTAAIDPIEETRIYKQFAEVSEDKTAILVTHRLGSARIADRILVMDDGKIVESGGHDELCARGGKYAQMWTAQAESYG